MGRMGPLGWSQYQPMNGVGTLGRQAEKATIVAAGWSREIKDEELSNNVRFQREIKINRDFFKPIKNNQVRKRTYGKK
jgi:hypothetical protein